jgi:hypothetical protein
VCVTQFRTLIKTRIKVNQVNFLQWKNKNKNYVLRLHLYRKLNDCWVNFRNDADFLVKIFAVYKKKGK